MPYTNREQQLSYMREYMKTKRLANRIEKLKQRKQRLLQRIEREPYIKVLLGSEKPGSYIDQQIEKLEGLLKMRQNSSFLGGGGKP